MLLTKVLINQNVQGPSMLNNPVFGVNSVNPSIYPDVVLVPPFPND